MARLIYETGVSPLRGHRVNTIFSLWKGIPTARIRSVRHHRTWQSVSVANHVDETHQLIQEWHDDVTDAQKVDWATYAIYLGTLSLTYPRIIGGKNYGGDMSAMDAFILTNSLRRSIEIPESLRDAPIGEANPPYPVFDWFIWNETTPIIFGAGYHFADWPPEGTYVRLWIRGKRYAHLLLAAVAPAEIIGSLYVNSLHFAQGNSLPLPRDIYEAQIDTVNTFGRFAPPTDILTTQAYFTTKLGYWDARLWDALVWGDF